MKKTLTQIAIIAAIFAVFFLGGFTVGRQAVPEVAGTRADTVIVRDTIRVKQQEPVFVQVVRTDTIRVKQAHTDTVYVEVEVPIEQKTYQTEDYKAVVEGFRPSLVSMEVYRQTQYIDRVQTVRTPDTRRWSVGLQVGYGFSVRDGAVRPSPYIGVGVQYSIFKW